ncbi:MAG: hypothetical protein M1830_003784 [Pleopsidium flavum]|nr:MAG: hypothetical protein M1830_003784 [Pleopsidium flavum]
MASLPYHEQGITQLLSLTSFLLTLNGSRYVMDHLLYCGLLGEIVIGIVWGTPLAGTTWLSRGVQETVQSLGYLGLIGLVFEGGMSTSPSQLRKTAVMSVSIATVGLCLPISLSFLLLVFPFSNGTNRAQPSPLAAFSAGASLCSTSLGTTFAILSAAGLQKTKLGVVLVGAAMMDDVVGLMMVKIVTALGSGDFTAWAIARPIVSSFALLLITLAITPYIIRPLFHSTMKWLYDVSVSENVEKGDIEVLSNVLKTMFGNLPHLHFILATLALIAFVTIAAFVDASVLLGAFIAGGFVKNLGDGIVSREAHHGGEDPVDKSAEMYGKYYHPVIAYILAPFFFASIGFAIPIRGMFDGPVLWKGILYTILMMFAKAAVGSAIYVDYLLRELYHGTCRGQSHTNLQEQAPHLPAAIISLAMIARGEIGFLIASLSSSAGTLTVQPGGSNASDMAASSQSIYLVITWAVVLCTLIGPIGVGFMVRKLRRLEKPHPGGAPNEVRTLILGRWA